MTESRQRRFWGWGYEDAGPDATELAAVEAGLRHFLGMNAFTARPRPSLSGISLRAPRVEKPPPLASILSDAPYDRAAHTYGRSYRDLVRSTRGDFSNPPDFVAFPRTEDEVVRVLAHCDAKRLAAIPFGGGSSVCGGVEPDPDGAFAGSISIDLGRLDRVLDVDPLSRAARVQAGVLGPSLEEQLRPSGLTLRHFPQSFEFSSLGGWIVTRAGGHYATLYTHIDDFVESVRVVTPTGIVETRRLPGSGAGPSPERLFLGSEGIFGIVTEAWMRLQARPRHRASFSAACPDFSRGLDAVRALAQSGLFPSNCRLLDSTEALLNGAGPGDRAMLLVAFESADHSVQERIVRAAELCRDHGAEVPERALVNRVASDGDREGAAGAWRSAFLRAPYLRDELVLRSVFVETFETATTWDRLHALHAAVTSAGKRAARETGGAALVTCRITHAYPDGAAPYFTVIAPAVTGEELAQWDTIKRAMTTAMLDNGGTTTHHHAVGRDFREYYERERSPGFAGALAAAKRALDPNGILNPGVLLKS
jgi:alkyldihydroxyacetonephosphate synthase